MSKACMKSISDRHPAEPKAEMIGWQVCENEQEWQTAQKQLAESSVGGAPTQAHTIQWLFRWWIPSLLVMLVFALSGAWWLWDIAQRGLEEIETEIVAAASAEQWNTAPERNQPEVPLQESRILNIESVPVNAGGFISAMEIRELDAEWAVVDLLVQPSADGPTYRQTRVYHYGDQGWVRAKSTAAHWGKAREYESNYFVLHYHSVDEEAVTQAAAQLDALYPSLYNTLFADAPTGEKVAIFIDPEWTFGGLLPQTTQPDPVTVPSPAATLRPAELPVGDLLLQSAMLALFDHLAEQATERYNLSPGSLGIYGGLRLWLIWEHDLPLARWREPLVEWVFRDPQVAVGAASVAIPTFAHDLCMAHDLWMYSPLDIEVAMWCMRSSEGEEKVMAWRYYGLPVELPLTSLMYRLDPSDTPSDNTSLWTLRGDMSLPDPVVESVGLATVFEYTASTYGVERIPLLLEALPHRKRVEALIPAVFGDSLKDFHRGWQAFVAERYGIVP
jgi:hypothetical protein